jgi:UDP-N-acetylbacillosamine N-acetyltransferase
MDLIVNFAPTGMIPTKEMTPHVPLSVAEIVEDVHRAVEIGISMVHLHARDEVTGEPACQARISAFDAGMINYARYLQTKGLLAPPFYFNLLLGNIACAQADLLHAGIMVRDLPDHSYWSLAGIGDAQVSMNSVAIAMGGGVRVGLEDNIYYDSERTRLATNADLLHRVHTIAQANGRRLMTPQELRRLLHLAPGHGSYGRCADTAPAEISTGLQRVTQAGYRSRRMTPSATSSATKKVVIWGATGPALIVADIVRLRGEFEIAGYLDNLAPQRKNTEFGGARVLGGEEMLDSLVAAGVRHLIFAFQNNQARLRLGEMVKAKGFELVTAIHPTASVAADAVLGAGTVVRAQSAIGPGARIGENCIIGYGAMVSHSCVLEDGVHLSSGVNLAGGTQIGRGTWIGLGATVIDPCHVGRNSLVGAGAVVTRSIPDEVVAYGVPAEVVRRLNERVA